MGTAARTTGINDSAGIITGDVAQTLRQNDGRLTPSPGDPGRPKRKGGAAFRARTHKRLSRWCYRQLRRRGVRRAVQWLGWDRPVVSTTLTSTIQAAAIDPLLTCTRMPDFGELYGRDLLTCQPIAGSVQELYDKKVISAPVVAIVGALGTTKSTTTKIQYVLRPLMNGTRVAVFDRKQQRDKSGPLDGDALQGEYSRAAQVIPGSEVLRLNRDRRFGTQINVLDPAISSTTTDAAVGQDELLRMVAESALERRLSPDEGYALAAAHRAALKRAQEEGRIAILSDVVDRLYAPDLSAIPGPRDLEDRPLLDDRGIVDVARVTEWGLGVALAFERFLQGDLSGIINGQTAGPDGRPINLEAPFLVVDTSALAEGSAGLGLVTAIMSTYLMARWASLPGFKHLILEEAYTHDGLDNVPTILRALTKRCRGVGAAVVSVYHHISDIPENSDMRALLQEADVVHIFRQDKRADAEAVVRMFGLPEDWTSQVQTLPFGTNVWKRGNLVPTLAQAFRSPLEVWVTYTDSAMMLASNDPDTED